MAVHTPIALEPDLQKLVDARLDTIDRMLMGRVPRTDRQDILREVESQIEELISEKDSGALGAEEILEILARLDPPEAYLVAGGQEESQRPSSNRSPREPYPRAPQEKPVSTNRLALAAGMIGILSLGPFAILTPGAYLIAVLLQSGVVLYYGLGLIALIGMAMGAVGLTAGLLSLGKGAWPIAGMATGALAMVLSIIVPATLYFLC